MKSSIHIFGRAALFLLAILPPAKAAPSAIAPFAQKYCIDCHDADSKKGGLDLTSLKFDLQDRQLFAEWVKIHDKVADGEMPPKKKARPDAADLASFTNFLFSSLAKADAARVASEGRATERRLNRYEYEDTLRDLFSLPYLEVKSFLPEDSTAYGFNKVGDALAVSHVQMARYLAAADFALHEAMAPQAARPVKTLSRYYTWEQRAFFAKIHLAGPLNRRTFPLIGLDLQRDLMKEESSDKKADKKALKKELKADPVRAKKGAMAVVVSTYEPTEIRFSEFHAPYSGWYKLKFSAYSVWLSRTFTNASKGHRSEPVTIYAEVPPRSLRKVGSFDVNPEPAEREMTVWLMAGETIRPDAARFFRSRPPNFLNPLATADGQPGLAFQWMDVEGPFINQWPPAGQQLLFGNLPMTNAPRKEALKKVSLPPGVLVMSKNPPADAKKLLRRFMQKAYRHPVDEADVNRFDSVIENAMANANNFTDSMIAGYTAVLSSPGFLYLHEKPGKLDDLALAERLSYFLWNSCPDAELRSLAQKNKLHQREILDQQTERMLNDPRSGQFIDAFLDYWLDLRMINDTSPDAELYPDYQLDDLLVESMIGETRAYFGQLVKQNLGVANLVDSHFVMLNERLAKLYGIPGVRGVELRPVALPEDNVRGGLLTQASILKVTSNGTTTSPVKRGAWVMARLLGKPPPPPPPSVPALEPDTRGATTIREQLAKHRSQETCAACHRNIDPAGFALESFDVAGAYRDRYRATAGAPPVKGIGHNGLLFTFCLGPKVDPSGELPDGRAFRDVRQLKQDLLTDQRQLARNMLRQLMVYATGAPIGFSDRPKVEKILDESQAGNYGIRTLIHQVVQSDMFLNK